MLTTGQGKKKVWIMDKRSVRKSFQNIVDSARVILYILKNHSSISIGITQATMAVHTIRPLKIPRVTFQCDQK